MNSEEKKITDRTENVFLGYLKDFSIILVVIMLVFFLLFRIIVVSGDSMYTTLHDGDFLLLASRVFYHNPKQGDIIVASKDSFRGGEPIIKRVIAVEGQTVNIDFPNGIVYVDGVALDEPYITTPTNRQEGMSFPLTVEPGCVFVMGDNRDESWDSRSKEIGLIDERQILGKAIFLFYPAADHQGEREFSRIGVLK